MAIIAALLVPALLRYTENSRAQKDVTAMDEVVNAVQLALADQDCFDEMELYSCENNYITYSDSSGKYGQQIIDAEYWAPDGYGRATTITFNPEKDSQGNTIYRLENAIVNDMTYGNGSIADNRQMQGAQISNNQCLLPNAKLSENQESGYLYNRVRQTIGNNVITTSATYANSSFTIFIRFSQKDGVTVADVNGSFNGTNLTTDASAAVGTGTNSEIKNPDTGEKEQGSATLNGGTQNNNYTGSSLQGSGVAIGGGAYKPIEDYKQPSYIENLQKENEFDYYSTLKAAVDDVNANTIGKHADCHKDKAVAGIYTKDGTTEVVLLKDHETKEMISTTVPLSIVLGGKKLSGTNIHVLETNSQITIDGRITGSEINGIVTQPNAKSYAIKSRADMQIYGGKYTSICEEVTGDSNAAIVCNGGNIYIEAAAVYAQSNARWSMGIALQKNCTNAEIKNCNIEAVQLSTEITGTHSSTGVNISGDKTINVTITDCTIIGLAKRTYSATFFNGGIGVYVDDHDGEKFININNCEIVGSGNGINIAAYKTEIMLQKCNIKSAMVAIAVQDARLIKIQNCTMVQSLEQFSDHQNYTNNYQSAININPQTAIPNVYIINCNLSANQYAISSNNALLHSSLIYISQTTVNKPLKLDSPTKIFIGLRNNFDINDISGSCEKTETGELYK